MGRQVNSDVIVAAEHGLLDLGHKSALGVAVAQFQQWLAVVLMIHRVFLKGNIAELCVNKRRIFNNSDFLGNEQIAGLGRRTIQQSVCHTIGVHFIH